MHVKVLDTQNRKSIQLQGGSTPLTLAGDSAPGLPLGALPPDPRYRLALCAHHYFQTLPGPHAY